MSALLWLSHPGVQALLNYLLDRLDQAQAQGTSLANGVKLNSASFPGLYKAKFEAERAELWAYTEQLALLGWIRLVVDRGSVGQPGYELRPRVHVVSESNIRAAVGRAARIRSSNELWREAVFTHLDSADEVRQIVAAYRLEISGRPAHEIVERLNYLKTLRDAPLYLREVSARLFWACSKILDKRGQLVCVLLGERTCPFPEIPIQLQVHLPEFEFTGVLFIENITNYERAIRAESGSYTGLALVFASGFKGSSRRIRTENGATVFFAECGSLAVDARSKFLAWLRSDANMPTWFWGDLDYAGMEILKAFRNSFPDTAAWKAGYEPMLKELEAGGGHTAEEAGKGTQRQVTSTGCVYADRALLPALKTTGKFVDQELF